MKYGPYFIQILTKPFHGTPLNPYAKEKRGKPKPKAKPKPKPSGMVKLEETPTDEPADLDGIQGRKLIHLPDADELKYDHSNSAPPLLIFSGEH